MTDRELLDLAIRARENAYAPYSGFAVGAALLAENGQVYLGCNVENASYTPTVCAERTAFFRALTEGVRGFTAIAIVGGPKEGGLKPLTPPCGVCRQVMTEFCGPSFRVVLGDDTHVETYTLDTLMPLSFTQKDL